VRYARGVLITLVSKGFAIPIGILSSIVTARYLGPSGRGVIAILTVIQGLALQFGTLGFNASIAYFVSQDQSKSSAVASIALVVSTIAGILIAAIFYAVARIEPSVLIGTIDPFYLAIFLVAIPFTFVNYFFQNVLIGFQKFYHYNVLDLISRFIQLMLYFVVLVMLRGGITEGVLCFAAGTIIAGILYLAQAARMTRVSFTFDRAVFREMFRYGFKTYIASMIMYLALRINIMLINYYHGEQASGVYSIATQLLDVVYLLPTTLGLILFPKVSSNREDSGELTAKVFRFAVLVMGLICLGIIIVGKPLINLLYGDKYMGAIEPLYWLTPGIFSLSLFNILMYDLSGRGMPPIVVIAPTVGLVINLVVNLIWLPEYGLRLAAVSSTVSNTIILLILIVYFVQKVKVRLRDMFFFTIADLKAIKI
jgi:O-antigen/teichoic acid export membrane protein